jgi:hypothetical protein
MDVVSYGHTRDTGRVTDGTAATREEAMTKFRAAWEKVMEHQPR